MSAADIVFLPAFAGLISLGLVLIVEKVAKS
jgi:hypothetical protein